VRVLVTGGAGFIGSNLVDRLVEQGDEVTVLDDLSTGFREHVHPSARFVEADVADASAVSDAIANAEIVFHQAAHRAVARSIDEPLATDTANVHGTLTLLKASVDHGVRRFVYASSSSVYGGVAPVPTSEASPPSPKSPYAVTKVVSEGYCRVFAELFGLETVSLRPFNVYGPRQRPDSAYAAVVPLFIEALSDGRPPTVQGDGKQSRDFTFISDVVDANLAAASAPADVCRGQTFNIGGGASHSLLDLLEILGRILGVAPEPVFTAPRAGDIRHSGADLSAARRDLGYNPRMTYEEGLARTVEWARQRSRTRRNDRS
jgi:UDP-glucose 4-epimerase